MLKAAWLRAHSPIWTITLRWRPSRRTDRVERRPPKQVTKSNLSQPRIKLVKHLLSWSTRSLKVVQTVTESKGQRRWAQPGLISVLKCCRTCSRSRVYLRTRSLADRIGKQWGTSTLKMHRQGHNCSNSSTIRDLVGMPLMYLHPNRSKSWGLISTLWTAIIWTTIIKVRLTSGRLTARLPSRQSMRSRVRIRTLVCRLVRTAILSRRPQEE